MLLSAYKHARLMAESQSRVEMAANSVSPADLLVAQRILDRPAEFTRWEAHHDNLMRAVSAHSRLAGQMVALRHTAFTLVHRKALFEYLRARQMTAVSRRMVVLIESLSLPDDVSLSVDIDPVDLA